jgi:hypothetical protein
MPSLATWFTPSLQTISRSSGRSSVLAAAYRACTELTDERLGITRDFTPKGKHGLAENICIGIPNDDIGMLFNNCEKAESRVNSTVARELMVPLPSDWLDVERAKCARGLGEMLRARYGVAVLVSIHRPSRDNNNYHAHILFTTRTVDAEGNFGKKTRILDDAKTGEVKKMREAVCEIVNTHARANGCDWYVYAGKFSDVLEDHISTKHISIAHGKNQRKYIEANREEVREAMAAITSTKNRIAAIDAEIAELQRPSATEKSSYNDPRSCDVDPQGSIVPPAREVALSRRPMPDDAAKAHFKIEAALKRRKELRETHEKWATWKKELEANRPNALVRLFGSYNGKVASAERRLTLLEDAARAQVAIAQDPDRQRLNTQFNEVIAHNVKVYEQELQLAKADAERVTKLAEENARQDQITREKERCVDWSAELAKSGREMGQQRSRTTVTTYGDDGFGM